MDIVIPSKSIYKLEQIVSPDNSISQISFQENTVGFTESSQNTEKLTTKIDLFNYFNVEETKNTTKSYKEDSKYYRDKYWDLFSGLAYSIRKKTFTNVEIGYLKRLHKDYYITSVSPTLNVEYEISIENDGCELKNKISPYYQFPSLDFPDISNEQTTSFVNSFETSVSKTAAYNDSTEPLNETIKINVRSDGMVAIKCVFKSDGVTPSTDYLNVQQSYYTNGTNTINSYLGSGGFTATVTILDKIEMCVGANAYKHYDSSLSAYAPITKLSLKVKSAEIQWNETIRRFNSTQKEVDISTTESANNEKKISLSSNPFIRSSSAIKSPTQTLYTDTLRDNIDGKEVATLRCSIRDYFYQNGEKVISISDRNKMCFEIGDIVIPMKRNEYENDEPISKSITGTPKRFKVLGCKKIFNGATWQELSLREFFHYSQGLSYKKPAYQECYVCLGLGECKDLDIYIPPIYNELPITTIDNNAFKETSIKSVDITDKITEIKVSSFYGCKNLSIVVLGIGLISIGAWAFSGCESLTTIIYKGTKEQWNTIALGSNWNYHDYIKYIECSDGTITL
jgi:hypothetical protein